MIFRRLAATAAFAFVFGGAGLANRAGEKPDGQRWWSHVLVLADDRLEGRGTGSPGHRKAAEYVAREFERAGLKPAGTEGFLQAVRLIARELDEAQSSLALVKDSGAEEPLVLGRDAIISSRVEPPESLEAGLVFAGHGLSIPEAHHDDFAGLDVRGKLVVLPGRRAAVDSGSAGRTHAVRRRAGGLFKRLGAIGTVNILESRRTWISPGSDRRSRGSCLR